VRNRELSFFLRSFRSRLFLALWFTAAVARPLTAAEPDYDPVMRRVEVAARRMLEAGAISGVTVAMVDDQQTVAVRGFGHADKARGTPSMPDTIYRAGSISKLFTALAAMQLTEQGRLHIDQPVTNFLPDFCIQIPFAITNAITLRQLMCHRSGLIRESPVGGYFDAAQAGTDASVGSVAECTLVYPPDTKTKYSNIGVTVVGQAVARVAGESFESYQQKNLLDPIGMTSSAFLMNRQLRPRLAKGYLDVADGRDGFREQASPHFELGTIPAGNLYTTAEDLARFLSFLFAEGRASGRQLVRAETLREMFTPQLTKESNGFGLGFAVGDFHGHKSVRHMGAVYGFTSEINGLPQHKIGVVVLCNDDIAIGPVRELVTTALGGMLATKTGAPLPAETTASSDLAPPGSFPGDYESESYWAKVAWEQGELVATISNQRMVLRQVAPLKFVGNGRLFYDASVALEVDASGQVAGFTATNQKFRRVEPQAVADIPQAWRRFLGSYGPDYIPVIISVKHGHLYAMTENEFDYRLTPLNRTVFKMPPGLYLDEQLVFQEDNRGRVHGIILANMKLRRLER